MVLKIPRLPVDIFNPASGGVFYCLVWVDISADKIILTKE
jgi:hypothetical protein